MNQLIVLEWKRNRMFPYHIAVMICGAVMLAFQYLMAAVPDIDPTEADIELFSSYDFLIGINHIVCMAIFAILASVMASRLMVEEYVGKRAVLLFSYPISRKKMVGAKLILIFLYPFSSMLLYGILIEGIFFLTESLSPFCAGHLTIETVWRAILSLLCHSLLAGLLGLIFSWVGFLKKSVPVTMVSAVIGVSLLCQVMAAGLSFYPAIFIALGVTAIGAAIATKSVCDQVEKMEV